MKTIRRYTGILALFATLMATNNAKAAATAFDTACNESMITSSNGGTGFQAWSNVGGAPAGGTFLSTTSKLTANGCTNAWGMFTGTSVATENAQRLFTSANGTNGLQPGQQVTVDMANGGVNAGGVEGLSLWNSTSNNVWELFFSGGSATWTVADGSGGGTTNFNYASSLGYNPSNGVRAVFTLTSASTYIARLTNFAGGSSSVTNTLVNATGGRAINQLRFFAFNIGSGNNITINNIGVSCPDTISFTTQPVSENAPTNDSALFTVDTFGDTVTHQWQSSSDGGSTWGNIATGTNTYNITGTNYESFVAVVATSGNNNNQYRCIATDACGNTATSGVATLTLSSANGPAITAPPANTTVCSNSPATFSVTASGSSPGYGWVQHANAGWGAGNGWSVTASNAGSGVFRGSSTNNESGTPVCTGFGNNDINGPTGGNALGMFGPVIKVLRQFPADVSAGQWFSIDMDNGNVDTGVQNGFSLHTSTANGDRILFSFYFPGGARNYRFFDGTGEHDTGIRFSRTGLRVQLLMGPAIGGTNSYSLFFQTNQCGSASAVTNTFTGSFATNGPAGGVLLFNNNGSGGSANDMYFNNIIAGAAYDNADNYAAGNWANGGNGGDLPISGATSSSYTLNNAQSNNVAYYVIVTNAVGAVVSSTATLTVNPNPNLGLSETDVSCNGDTNGSVQATFSGGTGTLQVNIDGGAYSAQASPYTFAGLSAGSHTVSVQDTKGCTSNLTIVVNQPTAVTITSTSKQDNTVCGGTAGSITVTASGGTGTWQYSKDGGTTYQSSNQFTGLASGTYSIVVKDANGCASATTPVTINDPNGPSFTFAQVNETCNGQSVGSITVTASGGSGSGYTYSKDNGATFQASNQFTGLAAGNYTVVVKDGNGCTSGGQVVTITQPSAVTFTTIQTNETCNGQSVGSITVTASGGSGSGYTYSKDNGATFQAGNQFTGLSAGTYQIVVQDSTGCLSSVSPVTITQPSALSCSVSPSIVTNCAGSPQIFTVSASGGTAGYAYSWSGPNSFSATGSSVTNNNVQPASAGTYTVTVTDANGCQSTCTGTLTVNVAPSITGQPTNTAVCVGSATNFTVAASGSPLNYVWRKLGSGWGGGGWVFSTIGSGSQFLGSSTDNDSGDTASNGGNDISTASKAWAIFNNGGVSDAVRPLPGGLQVGQTFSLDMDNGNVQTGGTVGFGLQNTTTNNDRLEVFFVGGSNDYTVSDNAGGNDSGIEFTRTGIHCQITLTSPDTYSITIIRYAGTVTAKTNTLTGTLKGTAGTTIDRVRLFNANAGDCGFGCNNFTLYFNNIGSGCHDDNAGNYTNWVAGSDLGQGPLANGGDISGTTSATLTINPASAGDVAGYDVFVTNSCGQAISTNVFLSLNSAPSITNQPQSVAVCVPAGTSFSVAASGGSTYQWRKGGVPLADSGTISGSGTTTLSISSTQTNDNLSTFDVIITSSNGCSVISQVATLTANASPSSTITAPSSVCANSSSNTASVSSAGAGASYAWTLGNGTIDVGQGTESISFTAGASNSVSISVTVTSSNGCSSSSGPVDVTITLPPSVVSNPNPTSACVGSPAIFNVGPGVGTTGFQWRKDGLPVSGLNISGANSPVLSVNPVGVLDAGNYDVVLSGTCGSTTSAVAALTVNDVPTATVSDDATICAGNSTTIEAALTGTGPWNLIWSDGFHQNSVTSSPATRLVSPGSTTVYTVSDVEDANCSGTASGSATVTINPTPSAPTAGNNGPLLAGSTLNLTASTVSGTTYNWTGPNGFASTNQNPSIVNVTSAASGAYSVTVTDTNGCTSDPASTTVLVTDLRVTAIAKEGSNIRVTWTTTGGTTNMLESTQGTPGYNTNFVGISGPMLIGPTDTSTNYLDVGGATNTPAEFYRVRLVP